MMSTGGGDPNSSYAQSGFDAFIQANPVSSSFTSGIAALSTATQFIKNLVSQMEVAFGIGKGRREADLITPYQNQLVSPPNAPLGIINTAYDLIAQGLYNNPTDLNEIYQLTKQAIDTFNKYIGYPDYPKSRWPDGRASRQAYADVEPYEKNVLAFLKTKVIEAGGTLYPIANTSEFGTVGNQLSNKLTQLTHIDDNNRAGFLAGAGLGGNGMLVLVVGVVVVAILANQKGNS